MTNDRELVKWAMTPAGNMAHDAFNWLESNSAFIKLFSQYLLGIYHVSASALVIEYRDEQDQTIVLSWYFHSREINELGKTSHYVNNWKLQITKLYIQNNLNYWK